MYYSSRDKANEWDNGIIKNLIKSVLGLVVFIGIQYLITINITSNIWIMFAWIATWNFVAGGILFYALPILFDKLSLLPEGIGEFAEKLL